MTYKDEYIIATPMSGELAAIVENAATDNLIGESCESGTRSTSKGKGFCFLNEVGAKLCGRTALWWSFGDTYAMDHGTRDLRETLYRPTACTPGAAATTDLTGPWTPRLLVGGCMISSDTYYTGWEEVHLPNACAVPADLPDAQKGCMDK